MLYSDKNDTSLNEVIVYIEMKRYLQAIARLKQLLSESPNNAEMLYIMSFCYYNLDSYVEAVEYCNESLEKGFSTETCYYLLGRIYMDMGQFILSEQHFLESLRINPLNASALSSYGMLMLRTGHEKKASQLMDEAMMIDPENQVVLHYKFIYYLFKGNKKTQLNLLQKYINNASSEVRKLIDIGIYNMHNEKYSEARENFRQAFLLDPTDKSTLSILEELDKMTNWIYLPNRLVDKLGGPAVIWLTFFILIILSSIFINSTVTAIIGIIYITFSIYTWLSRFIYKFYLKLKRDR